MDQTDHEGLLYTGALLWKLSRETKMRSQGVDGVSGSARLVQRQVACAHA